jgi:hypothetical protein
MTTETGTVSSEQKNQNTIKQEHTISMKTKIAPIIGALAFMFP